MSEVAVVGAGSSGLAAVRALREQGIAAECFERGLGPMLGDGLRSAA